MLFISRFATWFAMYPNIRTYVTHCITCSLTCSIRSCGQGFKCDNIADNMVFKVFFVISFPPCIPSYNLASLPPGIMLLNRSTSLRDSTIDIKKPPQKDAPEQERPYRSVVKTKETFIFNIFAAYHLLHAALVQSGDRTA